MLRWIYCKDPALYKMDHLRQQILRLRVRYLQQAACLVSSNHQDKQCVQKSADSEQNDASPTEGYNSLFLGWLNEWEAGVQDQRRRAAYRRAIESLRNYQTPLRSGEDALNVPYIGKVIAGRLSEKLMLHTCANPLFVKWLMEWREDAEKRQSSTRFGYGLVIQSLLKHQHSLHSARAAVKEVKHLSKPIAIRLDEKLKELYDNGCDLKFLHDIELVRKLSQATDAGLSYEKTFDLEKKRKYNLAALESEEYIPQFRTGAFALLLTLQEDLKKHPKHGLGYMIQPTLTLNAQPSCDWSFRTHGPFGCWLSMSMLIEKGLVLEESGDNSSRYEAIDTVRDVARIVGPVIPARYFITECGMEAAKRTENLLTRCFQQ